MAKVFWRLSYASKSHMKSLTARNKYTNTAEWKGGSHIFHMWWILLRSLQLQTHCVFNELLQRWRRVRESCAATQLERFKRTQLMCNQKKYMWIGIVSKYCNFSFPATATTLHCVQLNCTHCEEYNRSRSDLKSHLCNILDKLQTDEYVYGAGMKFGKCGLYSLGSSWKLSPSNYLHFHVVVFLQSTVLILPMLLLAIMLVACAKWDRCSSSRRGVTFCQIWGKNSAC